MKTIKLLPVFLLFVAFLLPAYTVQAQYRMNVEGNTRILGRIELVSYGTGNVFIGSGAGIALSTGAQNAFLGDGAGYLNSSGGANTYVGYQAGRNNRTGSENNAFGRFAMSNNEFQSKNIAIGSRALLQLQDGYGYDPVAGNVDLGTTYNLAIGTSAGQFTNDPAGSGSERNTFVGNNSGLLNTTGFRNAFFGFQAGDLNTTGNWNTCIGHEADVSLNNLNDAGAFGSGAIVNASYKIRIGDVNITTVEGNGWSLPSDGRFKRNVKEEVPGLDFIMALRPVTYQFDALAFKAHMQPDEAQERSANDPKQAERDAAARRSSERIQTGFIAQEVEAAAQKLNFDFNGVVAPTNPKDNYGLSYSLFVVPMVKGMQEQQEIITELQEKNDALEERIAHLEELIIRMGSGNSTPGTTGTTMILSEARLFQNRPNPFSTATSIDYYIPESVQRASMEILGMDGRSLKTVELGTQGQGVLNIEAGTFPAGTYVYRLILDGKVLDTKTMVLTH
ncbi:MAG: tail fiber domain-containing protein [Saprospiraceae bacterium]|nr:tail fiber domain-containing protein [Lewinella sp.]